MATIVLFALALSPTNLWRTQLRSEANALLPEREALYLLPLLPQLHEKPIPYAGLRWATTTLSGAGPLADSKHGLIQSGAEESGQGPGRFGDRPRPKDAHAPLESDVHQPAGGNVYVDEQNDHAVQRDPSSAGPAYPQDLEKKGIEGSVIVQYVVDTTGFADSASLVVDSTTQPAFAEAVRAALPHMRFQPALVAGHRVRQSVRQEFKFVLPHVADTAQTSRSRG